tara:strand:- start:3924 stop:4073 length:150 start_codon:yes stop_codon:yes gene_type:complete
MSTYISALTALVKPYRTYQYSDGGVAYGDVTALGYAKDAYIRTFFPERD